jgi:hypothetical protein
MAVGTEAWRRAWITVQTAVRAQREGTPFELESMGEKDEDGEEREMTPPPRSLQCKALHLLGDIFERQLGVAVDTRRLKWPRTETGPLTAPPPQPHLALVSPGLQGMSVVLTLMKTTHLFGISPVPLLLPDARVAMDMMVGPSSLGLGG